MIWTLYGAMVSPLGDSIYLRYFQEGSDAELTFVCISKKFVSVESVEYFPNMGFALGNAVGIDENVVQIYDDYDVNHIYENVIHKSLKSCWCISKPFRHYQPLKRTIAGLE